MKNYVVVALMALTGCLEEPTESLGNEVQEIGVKPGHCPDPGDCSVANGPGIYTEEGGHMGVVSDGYDFMIARFINSSDELGPYVRWTGRSELLSHGYGVQSGVIRYALYDTGSVLTQFKVTRIAETTMAPEFTLKSMTDSTAPAIVVTGADLYRLRLVVTTPVGYFIHTTTLMFSAANKPTPDYLAGYSGNKVFRYALYWYPGADPVDHDEPLSFCQRAPNAAGSRTPDYTVFQGGIDVDPLNANTRFDESATVTLSCAEGAIATATVWGYPYHHTTPAGEVLFEAAMHLKRASYCGDVTTYTTGGTSIYLYDGVIHADHPITPVQAEAVWGVAPDGNVRALCVNPTHERRPGLLYPPNPEGLAFTGECFPDDGTPSFTIPRCKGTSYPTAVMMDVPAP